jgi:uncharacterized protein (DUF2336 family)
LTLAAELQTLLGEKDEGARVQIAQRVGARLSLADLPEAERRAAELLARDLVRDAIERVRQELSIAVRHAKHLPRDIALKIAHDVDAVACPFLEVTEVFSEADWQQLVLTISRGARIAAARRTSMSDGLALALAETGDAVVAETLVANQAAPMTLALGQALIDRFRDSAWVLDKLAERNGLTAELAGRLYPRVGAAAREKLSRSYGMAGRTDPIGLEAEGTALLGVMRGAPEARLLAIVESLRQEGKLGSTLLLLALRDGLLEFFAVALSALSNSRLEEVRSLVSRGGAMPMTQLLARCQIPRVLHGEFWEALQLARKLAATLARSN